MSLLFESIKVFDRKLWNIQYHNDRMNRSRSALFNCKDELDLADMVKIPGELSGNLFKCRVRYSERIHDIEFHPYTIKPVTKLIAVYDDFIEYEYKWEDRRNLQKHLCRAEEGEILIVKNGLITDTSYSNVVLSDSKNLYTPAKPLLKGTKRESLLAAGKITEKNILATELKKFEFVYIINALIDLDDEVHIPVESIIL